MTKKTNNTMQFYAKYFITIVMAFFCYSIINAQNFQQVSHIGISAVGSNIINLTTENTGAPIVNTQCAPNIYNIANTFGAHIYQFRFYTPVQHIKLYLQSGSYDEFSFMLNGQHYNVLPSNILPVPNAQKCMTCSDTFYRIIDTSGNLYTIATAINGVAGCAILDLQLPKIDSFRISALPGDNSDFQLFFLDDTAAYINDPLIDTAYCPGQQFSVPYFTSKQFNGSNTFSIQMSDASGSFSSPTTIGTHADTVGDTILCTIPPNTPPGTGYKFRIVGSSPTRISYANNPDSITIKATVTGFSNGSNTPVCSGDSLKLNGTSTSTGVTWAWTGVASFSSSAEDTFILNPTVAMSGDYILTATLNSTGCSLRDTVTVQVKPTPNKPTTGSNAPLCAGGSLNLTSSSTSTGISYSWAGPGGYTSSSQNPTINNISAAASGDYISTVTMNGCTNKDTISVVINPIPNKPTAGSNSPLCAGQALNLTASTINNATYTWWGPAAYSATLQNPTRNNITTSHAGIYYVFATVNGCNSDTDSVAVQVNPDPQVNVVATPGSNICAGQSATFVAFTSNAGATPTFKWMLNGVATGNTTTSYINSSLQTGDVVYCIMDATGNCSGSYTDTSNISTMLVSPVVAPTVTINANPALPVAPWTLVTFTATPINGGVNPTYQWKRNGQDVVGATNDTWGTYQLSDGDVVSVVLYSTYQCADPDSAVSNAINIQLNLDVDDLTAGTLQLYPNPNNGSFTLKGNVVNNKPIDLTIINKLGQLVYQTTIQPQNNTINQQININKELATGIYLLQLKTEDAHSNVKLQIQ